MKRPVSSIVAAVDLSLVTGGMPSGRTESAPGKLESAPYGNQPPSYSNSSQGSRVSERSYYSSASRDPGSNAWRGQNRGEGEAMFPGFDWSSSRSSSNHR